MSTSGHSITRLRRFFCKVVSVWVKLSRLGLTVDMPIYRQKTIVLFNQLVLISALITSYVMLIMLVVLHLHYMPMMFAGILCILVVAQFMAYRKKIVLAVLTTSTFLPFLLLCTSVYSKLHGESNTLFLYFTPRVFIGMYAIQSVAFIGFSNQKKGILGIIPGVLIYILYDVIHRFFGIGLDRMYYDPIHHRSAVMATAISFVFVSILIVILQNINQFYEKIVIQQKDDLQFKAQQIEQQRNEIEAQHESVVIQMAEIVSQKKLILDSINYARNIQSAIFPSQDHTDQILKDHFIFFKPRNTVSGDFYFLKEINEDFFVLAAADCTGHGVPGAFMSILGITFLNDIISLNIERGKALLANDILDQLRSKIKTSLHQTGEIGELQDGMDIALCIIDRQMMCMQYAGANSPAYIIRRGASTELFELKPDSMPIGIYKNKKDAFANQIVRLEPGDALYLFSDGYKDQFGGTDGRKYLSRNFKELLLSIAILPMAEQRKILEETHNAWIGDQFEQLDDILVMGVRI